MEYNVVECDGCGADLSDFKQAGPRYCLVLKSEYILLPKDWDGPLSAEQPLDREHHFCGVRCIDQWIIKRTP